MEEDQTEDQRLRDLPIYIPRATDVTFIYYL
jgi:hypothetical protein